MIVTNIKSAAVALLRCVRSGVFHFQYVLAHITLPVSVFFTLRWLVSSLLMKCTYVTHI